MNPFASEAPPEDAPVEESHPPTSNPEDLLDETLKESFPASDPPSTGQITKLR